MAYDVNKKDGTLLVTVADGALDSSATTIKLLGRGVTNFGEIMAENLVWMMENFANGTAPSNPVEGQLWFNTTTKKMNMRSNAAWRSVGSATSSATAPTSPAEGDLWWDSANDQLYAWDGSSWVLVGPSSSTDPLIAQDATMIGVDLTPGPGQMTLVIVDGLVVACWSAAVHAIGDYSGNINTINVGGTNVSVNLPASFPSGVVTGLNMSENAVDFPGGLPTLSPIEVLDSTVSINTAVSKVNFGTNLTVTNNGSGQVTVDAAGGGSFTMPYGSVQMYAGASAPSEWLFCDGSAVSQTTYASLFAAIGVVYNTGGEGAGNFRLPDFRGRSALGAGTGAGLTARAAGDTGGEEDVTLTEPQLASHTHTGGTTSSAPNHTHSLSGTVVVGGSGNPELYNGSGGPLSGPSVTTSGGTTGGGGNHSHTITSIGNAGSGAAHENMHPFLGINFIIYAGV